MALTVETIPGTTHTLSALDDGKLLRFTNASTITVTADETNTTGFEVLLYQAGAGQVQVEVGGTAEFLEERAPITKGTNAILHTTCPEDGKYKFSGEFASAAFLSLINIAGGAPPTVSDDATSGYSVGSAWFFGNDIYDCTDASVGAAVWILRASFTTTGDGDRYLDDQGNYTVPSSTSSSVWNASTTLGPANPGSGNFRWNNATQNLATIISLSVIDDNGTDLTNFLAQLGTGDALYIQRSNNANQYQRWSVDSVVDNTTYLDVTVSLISDSGGNISNNATSSIVIENNGGNVAAAFEEPTTSTSSQGLTVLNDRFVMADPTSGAIVLTLPDATSKSGTEFTIKRTTNGGNSVTLGTTGSDTIDGNSAIILAHKDEHISVISDGTTEWRIINKQIATFASLGMSSTDTQALTTSFSKIDIFDTDVISTTGKLEADGTNSKFDILAATGVNTYRLEATLTVESAINNSFIEVRPYANGALTGTLVAQNGLGSGKPITLVINQIITAIGNTSIELHALVETNQTITYDAATWSISKLSGE